MLEVMLETFDKLKYKLNKKFNKRARSSRAQQWLARGQPEVTVLYTLKRSHYQS